MPSLKNGDLLQHSDMGLLRFHGRSSANVLEFHAVDDESVVQVQEQFFYELYALRKIRRVARDKDRTFPTPPQLVLANPTYGRAREFDPES